MILPFPFISVFNQNRQKFNSRKPYFNKNKVGYQGYFDHQGRPLIFQIIGDGEAIEKVPLSPVLRKFVVVSGAVL
jgi:hypothetical protein